MLDGVSLSVESGGVFSISLSKIVMFAAIEVTYLFEAPEFCVLYKYPFVQVTVAVTVRGVEDVFHLTHISCSLPDGMYMLDML